MRICHQQKPTKTYSQGLGNLLSNQMFSQPGDFENAKLPPKTNINTVYIHMASSENPGAQIGPLKRGYETGMKRGCLKRRMKQV